MPSSIPYDPSLTLGSIVHPNAIDAVLQIATEQAKVDAEEEKLNAFIAQRRSLDMTISELANLEIDTASMMESKKTVNDAIKQAAEAFGTAKVAAESKISEIRPNIRSVHVSVESPVDYVKTQIKTMPLAADSINMNVQYFSFDSNKESSEAFAQQISGFVSKSSKFLGTKQQTQLSAAAQKQAASQAKAHALRGTLVLSVSCTHKNAAVMAPFILNVDKGIKVWNHQFPDNPINPTSQTEMAVIAAQPEKDEDKKLTIISGQTFGSSFIGMVHILNTSSTSVTESISSVATSLQQQMDAGAWLQAQSGGYGVNASIGTNVKNLLSSQEISSHVTMICMGAIPSMVANEVHIGVDKFRDFNPQSSMEAIATIQNATAADQGTVKASADAARTGKQMETMRVAEIKASLSALAEIDDGNNKVLDINSMMTALDDYLKKAAEGSSGVPINYYLKDISRQMLAEMWVSKYFPGKYLGIVSDDSDRPEPAGEGGAAS